MTTNSYDDVPYASKVYYQTQPIIIKKYLTIFGITTPKIKGARILELGCSFGGNIITQAINFPDTTFIGVDLSSTQINYGNKIIDYLKLDNIQLLEKNILDINADFGQFDYIIVHGIFSWVSDEVRDKILDIFKNNLKQNGIAFVSYNCYPGWKQRQIFRDIMNFRAKCQADNIDSNEKLKYGLGAIEFLAKNGNYSEEFKEEANNLSKHSTSYLIHEYFEDNNRPFYFYEFNNLLKKHNLNYITDTSYYSIGMSVSSDIYDAICKETNDDFILNQQYLDFITNKGFRNSLVSNSDMYLNMVSNKISNRNLSNYHLRSKYSSEGIPENLQYIIKHLEKKYPNTVSVNELVDLFNSTHENVYLDILTLMAIELVDFYVTPIKFPEKLHINPKLLDLLEMLALQKEFPIGVSDIFGSSINLDLKLFVGLNLLRKPVTIEYIKEEIKNLFLNKVLVVENGEIDDAIKTYYNELLTFLYNNLILEGCALDVCEL